MPEIAVFGGGCFWCADTIFRQLKGVMKVVSGYAGGATKNPTYERISAGRSAGTADTGHAEVIKVIFNSALVSYRDLLTVFFATHDATTLNQQGNDVGTQYRSIILYTDEAQKIAAEEYIAKLNEDGATGKIVTELAPLGEFYDAEDYHQDYYENNKSAPYCEIMINPKLKLLKEKFDSLLAS